MVQKHNAFGSIYGSKMCIFLLNEKIHIVNLNP